MAFDHVPALFYFFSPSLRRVGSGLRASTQTILCTCMTRMVRRKISSEQRATLMRQAGRITPLLLRPWRTALIMRDLHSHSQMELCMFISSVWSGGVKSQSATSSLYRHDLSLPSHRTATSNNHPA